MDLGSGSYSFTMDSHLLGMTADTPITPTSYFFVITINKLGYESPFAVTIIILVLQTPTEMTSDPVEPVIWSEELTLRVHLRDTIHSVYVWENAIVTLIYGEFSRNFTSLNNGTFVLTFNSQEAFNSSLEAHGATVVYTIPNYIDGEIDFDVTVNPVPASIILDDPASSVDWASTFELSIGVRLDSDTLVNVNVSIAYYYWVGYEDLNGTLVYNPTWNLYEGTVDAGLIPAGTQILTIVAVQQNYTIPVRSYQIEILELDTVLTADVESIHAIIGVDASREVRLTYTSDETVLSGATVTFFWDGLERTASWDNGEYVFQFDPSGDDSLIVPGIYELNFTAQLMNYTIQSEIITLHLAARTQILAEIHRIEEGLDFILLFQYWDMVNDEAVGGTAVVQYSIGEAAPVTVTEAQFDGTYYRIPLSTADIGVISPDAYTIAIYASAPGYQNWTMENPGEIQVFVNNPTVDILSPINYLGSFLGVNFGEFRIQRDILFLIIAMTGLFALSAVSVRQYQRWRIPHAIKQINRAIKQIENGKVASVEGVKSMGVIISELLAPGLAELDIEAPLIDSISEGDIPGVDETTDILGELDTLDDIGVEESESADIVSDFESELEAELDEVIEADSEVEKTIAEPESDDATDDTPEVEIETEEADVVEDAVEESPTEPEPDVDTEVEAEEEPEEIIEPVEDISEPEVEEAPEAEIAELDDEIAELESEIESEKDETLPESAEGDSESSTDETASESDSASEEDEDLLEDSPFDDLDFDEDE
jgi:hypothetical protein